MVQYIHFGVLPSNGNNGMLGSYPTNSRQIEPQITRKFIQQQQVHNVQLPPEFSSLSQAVNSNSRWTGSLLESMSPSSTSLLMQQFSECEIGMCNFEIIKESNIDVIPPICEYVLSSWEFESLKEMYKMLYPNYNFERIYFRRVCQKLEKNISFCGYILASAKGNTDRNSCISAFWKSPSNLNSSIGGELRFGHIQYFLNHCIQSESSTVRHIIAVVNWNKKHPNEMYFGSSAYVVRNDVEVGNSFCLIPVQRLASRCGFGSVTIHTDSEEESVIVIIPIPFKFCV